MNLNQNQNTEKIDIYVVFTSLVSCVFFFAKGVLS